jgi:3-dehydroquinate dehydratase
MTARLTILNGPNLNLLGNPRAAHLWLHDARRSEGQL